MDTGQVKILQKETRVSQPQQSRRKRLGEIFVEQGLMLPVTAERLAAFAVRTGKRFGTVLEELGVVTAEELAEALALQYGAKLVKHFADFAFDEELLQMVPVETAVEQCMFPLKAERGVLAVAICDPTNLKIASNIAANRQLRLVPFIGTRKEIHRAISRHYLKREATEDGRKKILLVESDKLIRQMLRPTLEREGYAVYDAENGMEGFKLVISVKPDLIITGKEMAKLDGYMFFDSIRKFPEMVRTPVILISSSTSAEDEAAAFSRGFFDFIPKPVKEPTLLVKVQRALAASSLV
ncbi:MAG TPA: response regulator [Verrucomicrobiae bacterium]|nr:response regulator [Verrucomicrobiae bacterium]